MSDKQTLIDMLTRAGVEFEIRTHSSEKKPFRAGGKSLLNYEGVVLVEAGYSGFVTEFFFDAADGLLYMGAWE